MALGTCMHPEDASTCGAVSMAVGVSVTLWVNYSKIFMKHIYCSYLGSYVGICYGSMMVNRIWEKFRVMM